MIKLDWNRERYRTRDRLLDYDQTVVPLKPHSAGLPIVYPWENLSTSVLSKQLFDIAAKSGFDGTQEDFNTNFGRYLQNKEVVFARFVDFPQEGETAKLYFDLDENILYYWNTEYIPVNALLIAGTILDSGNALDEIGGDLNG